MWKIILLSVSMAVAWAAPQPDMPPTYGYNPPPPPPPATYNQPGMPFKFAYAVKDYFGNDYAHEQKSDGEITTGSYRVALPDGRIQTVTFEADDYGGYVAKVTYEGEAEYPAPAPYPPTPAPYHPTPAPYHPTPAPYHPTPAPYHPPPTPVYG